MEGINMARNVYYNEMAYRNSVNNSSGSNSVANLGFSDYVGPTLILLGQKIVPKPGGAGGGGMAGPWTSPAAKGLRWTDRAIQGAFKTDVKFAARGIVHRYLGTRGIGAAAGRFVPYVGWAWTAWDVGWELGKYYGPSTWFQSEPEPPKSILLEYMLENGMLDEK